MFGVQTGDMGFGLRNLDSSQPSERAPVRHMLNMHAFMTHGNTMHYIVGGFLFKSTGNIL